EPVAPRQVCPQVPRDLETIILKCLAKEPRRRYAAAQDLVDDLRAFLDGRAIKARRPSFLERAVRWTRKNRRSAALTTATALLSVLLVVGGWLGWRWYSDWRLGRCWLIAEEPSLNVEVLAADRDDVVLPQFPLRQEQTLAQEQILTLPAGPYRLRLSSPG